MKLAPELADKKIKIKNALHMQLRQPSAARHNYQKKKERINNTHAATETETEKY